MQDKKIKNLSHFFGVLWMRMEGYYVGWRDE